VVVHLIDGTYELFRHYHALPPARDADGREVGAVRGVLTSLLGLMKVRETYIGVATDHVIESFRNELWPGYKTSEGMPPELLMQTPVLERALEAMGVTVWAMVEYEADDALAAGAARFAQDARRVHLCTIDKDLAQCVRGDQIILVDRKGKTTLDEPGVVAKFGVPPRGIPDYLALVGDTSDGFPGLPGFGKKTAAALVTQFGALERIPLDPSSWPGSVRGRERLAETLAERADDARLFKQLATLRSDVPLAETLEDLRWRGARPELRDLSARHGFPEICERVPRWA